MLSELLNFLTKNFRTDLALQVLDAFEEKSTSVHEMRDLACLYSSLGEHEKAINLAEKACSVVSDFDERNRILIILSRIFLNAGNPNKSEEVFLQLPYAFQLDQLKNEIYQSKIDINQISETGFWSENLSQNHLFSHCLELNDWIANYLDKEKLVIDLGCGLGCYLKFLSERGFKNLLGFEGEFSSHSVFDNIKIQDLTIPFQVEEKGNVVSLEVGEHIPRKYEDIYINNICDACNDNLIISWAVRGQGGCGHVNCKNNEEIIRKVESKGFIFQQNETIAARETIKDHCFWFKNTILVFKKNE